MPAHASRTLAPAPSAPPSDAERRLLAPARPRHRPANAATPAERSGSPASRPVKLRSVDSGLYGELIAQRDFLLAQSGFVDRVCRPLIVHRNAYGFRWLARLLRSAPDLLRLHEDQQAVRDFRGRVSAALQSLDDDEVFGEATRSIARVLDVPLAAPASE